MLCYLEQEIEKGKRQQSVAVCSSVWEGSASKVLVPQSSGASQRCPPCSREKHSRHSISKQILERALFLEEDPRGHFNQQVQTDDKNSADIVKQQCRVAAFTEDSAPCHAQS